MSVTSGYTVWFISISAFQSVCKDVGALRKGTSQVEPYSGKGPLRLRPSQVGLFSGRVFKLCPFSGITFLGRALFRLDVFSGRGLL